jgi:hypothetical protein
MKTKQTYGEGFNDARDRIKRKIRRMKRNPEHRLYHIIDNENRVMINATILFDFIMQMDDRAKKTPARKGKA